jgi:hypothetical protein
MKDLMVIMDSFMKWIEPTLDEMKTKEVDFNCSSIQLECEDFSECKDISQEKTEMGYYQLKKTEYMDKLKEWERSKERAMEKHQDEKNEGNTLTADDIINLQKNDFLWGNEGKYEIWEEVNEQDEVSNKMLEFNRKRIRANVVVNKQEITSDDTGKKIPTQTEESNSPQPEASNTVIKETPKITGIKIDKTKPADLIVVTKEKAKEEEEYIQEAEQDTEV